MAGMKWSGTKEFRAKSKALQEELRVAAARVCMEAAKETRDRALEGFNIYGIRMVTGRSRALYAAAPGEGMFTPGAKRVTYEVGYLNWPEYDRHSPTERIPFYPHYLNYGTVRMSARPYHTNAVEAMEPIFRRKSADALASVMRGRKTNPVGENE